MSEFIRQVSKVGRESAKAHNPGLEIGMRFCLPSVSKLAGTDFAQVYRLFDWVSPKFPDYVPGTIVPLIADEIASRSGRWGSTALRETIRELFDLGPGPKTYDAIPSPQEGLLYSNTFDSSVTGRQMRHLLPLQGKVPMYPSIWLHGRDLEHLRGKISDLRENGFDGFFLWVWERGLTTESLKESKGVF